MCAVLFVCVCVCVDVVFTVLSRYTSDSVLGLISSIAMKNNFDLFPFFDKTKKTHVYSKFIMGDYWASIANDKYTQCLKVSSKDLHITCVTMRLL